MREILLLVGTDHHAFQRAVRWADDRQAAHPDEHVFIQYGKSEAPVRADGAAFLSPEQMREAVAKSDVVITHGGPGTISDARHGGHRPIVFPRDPNHGEHVDDHQQRFAGWCDRRGLVHFAHTVDDLDAAVAALGATGTRGTATSDPASVAAISRVGALLDGPRQAPRVRPGAPVILHLATDSPDDLAAAEQLLRGTVGIMNLGDVANIWRDGVARNGTCECGDTFSECPFWTEVGSVAFGGWKQAVADGVDQSVDHLPGSPWGLARRFHRRASRDTTLAYVAPFRAIFEAARQVSGAEVLSDSSRLAAALAWSHDRQLDVRALQIAAARPARAQQVAVRLRGLPTQRVSASSLEQGMPGALRALLGDSWSTESSGAMSAQVGSHPLSAALRQS